MPANLSPEYKAAEAAYRRAREPGERLECLREMLRTIPKHKGTDHLQADIKHRIKELTEELSGPRKGAARGGPPTVIHREGAAQLALLGPPNSGKSTLHQRLTGSTAAVGPYPFTTQYPQPGMLPFEDIHFQLVDLAPVSPEHPTPWLANSLQPADGSLLVLDLTEADCVEQTLALRTLLAERRVHLSAHWAGAEALEADGALDDPFALVLPTLMLFNKRDAVARMEEEIQVFLELTGLEFPHLAISARTGEGLGVLAQWLFHRLGVVRVYTKAPGRPPDRQRPFTVRLGQTVEDVARLVHRDIAHDLRYARLWGSAEFDGQQVGRDHPLRDGDVVELHA